MPFGDHLRADENVEIPFAKVLQNIFELPFAGHGIAIEPGDFRFREFAVQFNLDALRSGSHEVDVLALAFWTNGRNFLCIAAIVAEQPAIAPVIRQRDRAIDTLDAFPAGTACDEGRETAAIQQDHRLFIVGETLANGLDENAGKDGVLASLQKFLEGTPGYQFTKQQGLESTTNNFTAQGLGGSGAEGKGLINYSEGLASTTYQQQLDNYLKQLQQQYGMLSGATGIGTQAASALAGVGTTTGQGIAQSLTGAGAAQAGANVASGNAIATGASNILPSYLTAQLLQKYGGGSGLNMFGGGSAVTNPVYNNTGQPT